MAVSPPTAAETTVAELNHEIRDLIVRIAQLLGYQRSMGEIYALLYVSTQPLSMDQIRSELRMSMGSASQGLKTLRGLKAVKTVYIPGQRKDFYEAETFIRNLVRGFLKEEVSPILESGKDRIHHLQELNKQLDDPDLQEHYGNRITQIQNLNTAAAKLIPLLNRFLKP